MTHDPLENILTALSTKDIISDSVRIVRETQDSAYLYVNRALIARN